MEVGGKPAVPAPVALLTAGVDVQDNRIEISVWGWGSEEESWLIEHSVLYAGKDWYADPTASDTWEALDAYLRKPWPREAGGADYIRAVGLDTGGHHTQAAYAFCSPRYKRMTPDGGRSFVFAMKGQAGAGEVWPRKPSKLTKKVPLWPIRVDPAKEQVYGRLSIVDRGPGYVHLPTTIGVDYVKGLTAEKVVTRINTKGFPERGWELRRPGLRNEPLDCAVYAYAALCGLKANGFNLEVAVENIEKRPKFDPPPEGKEGKKPSAPVVPTPMSEHERPRRRTGWRDDDRSRGDWWRGR